MTAAAGIAKTAARQYIDRYAKECYHKSVTIIPEPAGSGFSFLQGNFVFNPKFTAFYESKNYQHWIQHGTLKTILLQQYYSYCESYSKQRFATLVGKLHEITNFSYPKSQARRGLVSILPDLATAGYPWSIIAAAMKRMARQTGYNKWYEWINPIFEAYNRVKQLMTVDSET